MKLRLGICLIASAVLYCAASPESAAADGCKQRLKIGVSLPLSAGPAASGEAVKNSILLADELYDTNSCVDFIFEDDQLQPKTTVTVVSRFLSADKVDGLIVYGTPTSRAVTPLADEAKVPMIALSILDAVVKDRKYVVKHWCTIERLNAAVVSESERRGYKTVAIVSTINDAMSGLRDQFRAATKLEVLADWEMAKDDFDFATAVLKVKSVGPNAIYVLLYPPQTGPFVRKLREAGYTGELFGVHNIEDPGEVKASAGAMLGMWFANGDASGEDFPARYTAKFGKPVALGGGSGFDAAKLFIQASGRDGDVNTFLHTVKYFHGAFGEYSATDKADFDFPACIKSVTQDGFPIQLPFQKSR